VAALVAGCGGGSSKPSASVVNTVCPKAALTVKALKAQLTSFKQDVNESRYASLGVDSRAVADSVDHLATDVNRLGYPDFASKIRTFASDLVDLGRDAGRLKISALGSDAQTLQAAGDAVKNAKAPSEHVCKAFKNLAELGG
jgi:hypothetical protein